MHLLFSGVNLLIKSVAKYNHSVYLDALQILQEIQNNGIKIYSLPEVDEDEDQDYKEEVRQLKDAMPFAVSGSSNCIEVKGKKVRGRYVSWLLFLKLFLILKSDSKRITNWCIHF